MPASKADGSTAWEDGLVDGLVEGVSRLYLVQVPTIQGVDVVIDEFYAENACFHDPLVEVHNAKEVKVRHRCSKAGSTARPPGLDHKCGADDGPITLFPSSQGSSNCAP